MLIGSGLPAGTAMEGTTMSENMNTDDVEGHVVRPRAADEIDDVEGHVVRPRATDDDV
ncbi:MAG: hypothetical protein QOJ34_3338, partial [Pseudonocardiales bacterium]|nr:hypothetical protein [Pseudonocardiales bacterium]